MQQEALLALLRVLRAHTARSCNRHVAYVHSTAGRSRLVLRARQVIGIGRCTLLSRLSA